MENLFKFHALRNLEGTSVVLALTELFDAALAGGEANSINFQELAADLAEIYLMFQLLPLLFDGTLIFILESLDNMMN